MRVLDGTHLPSLGSIVRNFVALYHGTVELPSCLRKSGPGFAFTHTEKPATNFEAIKTARTVLSGIFFCTSRVEYMPCNRAPADRHIFPKHSHTPGFDRLLRRILSQYSEYSLPVSDITTWRCITSYVIHWFAAKTTPYNTTFKEAAHILIMTTDFRCKINVTMPSIEQLN